jgi:hypothetical protein
MLSGVSTAKQSPQLSPRFCQRAVECFGEALPADAVSQTESVLATLINATVTV